MLAMVMVAAAPAMAQQSGDIFQTCINEFGDQSVSANVDQDNVQDQDSDQISADNEANAESGDADADQAAGQAGIDVNGDGVVNEADNAATSGDADASAGNNDSTQTQYADNEADITQNVTQEQIAICNQVAESVAAGEIVEGDIVNVVDQYKADGALVIAVDEDGDGVDDVTGEVIAVDEDGDGVDDVTGEVIVSAAPGDAAAAAGGVLPDTGGASLIALGAGALLVAGGLLARRIVR